MNSPILTLLKPTSAASASGSQQTSNTATPGAFGVFDLMLQSCLISPETQIAADGTVLASDSDITGAESTAQHLLLNAAETPILDNNILNISAINTPQLLMLDAIGSSPAVLIGVTSPVMTETPATQSNIALLTAGSIPETATEISMMGAVPQIIQTIEGAIPQGFYNVVSSSVRDGQATFDLTDEHANQTLRVTIPIEQVHKTFAQTSVQRHSANISTNSDTLMMQQLLAKTDVTGIEITHASAPGKHHNAPETITFDMFAEKQVTHSLFHATVKPSHMIVESVALPVVASRETKASHTLTQIPFVSKDGDQATTPVDTGEHRNLFGEVALVEDGANNDVSLHVKTAIARTDERPAGSHRFSSTFDKTLDSADNVNDSAIDTPEPARSHTDAPVPGAIVKDSHTSSSAIHVDRSSEGNHVILASANNYESRTEAMSPTSAAMPEHVSPIVVTDAIESELTSGNAMKSITLQLRPEHLGTARVHLTVQNDVVSARVIVNSHQAKAAIEGSLHDLLAQFDRAQVRVEHIHVAVSGEWHNSEQNRRNFWQTPRQSQRSNNRTSSSETPFVGVVSRLFAPPLTTTAAGLNVLA